VAELRTAHTADLDPVTLQAARALLEEVFDGDLAETDWEHALGGVHALVWDGPALIGHGSVIQRRLLHQGRALRAGYVEAVAVRADRQGQGHGAALMGALERVLRGAYDLGALGSSAAGPVPRADLRLAGRGCLVTTTATSRPAASGRRASGIRGARLPKVPHPPGR